MIAMAAYTISSKSARFRVALTGVNKRHIRFTQGNNGAGGRSIQTRRCPIYLVDPALVKITFQLDSPYLYKYCDTRGIDILQSLHLKVTPPIEFNDPFEFMPRLELRLSKESVAKRMSSTSMVKSLWKDFSVKMSFEEFREIYLRELQRPKSA